LSCVHEKKEKGGKRGRTKDTARGAGTARRGGGERGCEGEEDIQVGKAERGRGNGNEVLDETGGGRRVR